VTDLAQPAVAATHWRPTLQRAISMMLGQFGPERTRDLLLTFIEQVELEHDTNARRTETA